MSYSVSKEIDRDLIKQSSVCMRDRFIKKGLKFWDNHGNVQYGSIDKKKAKLFKTTKVKKRKGVKSKVKARIAVENITLRAVTKDRRSNKFDKTLNMKRFMAKALKYQE